MGSMAGVDDSRREEPLFPVDGDGNVDEIGDDMLCAPCEDEEEAVVPACLLRAQNTWTTA